MQRIRSLNWVGRFVIGGLALVVALLVFTTVRASVLDGQVLAQPCADSLLVDIGERQIHFIAQGLDHTGPAVVLLPCLGCGSIVWQAVQPALAESLRVYAYDPAGFAWSDPAPEALSSQREADDLHAALVALGETDVILVAFSASGTTTLLYLDRYTTPQVRGVVWVEGEAFTPEGESIFGGVSPLMPEAVQAALIELGVGRVFYEQVMEPMQRAGITAEVWSMIEPETFERLMATFRTRRTLRAGTDLTATYPAQQTVASGLHVPAEIPVFALDANWASDLADLSPEEASQEQAAEATRAEVWQAMADSNPEGRYIPVENSSHMIPLEQPQVVIQAIRDLAARVQ